MRGIMVGLLAATALLIAGCADGEGQFVASTSSHFTPGVTTRAAAVAQMGPPSSVYQTADGSRTLTWARTGGLFAEAETRSLSVLFGPDDRMVRVVNAPVPAP